MKHISVNRARDIAFGVNEDGYNCADCLFDGYGCSGCSCAAGKVLKRLVNEGFLSIDENAEKGGEQ